MKKLKYTVAATMMAAALPASAQQLSIATGGTGGVYYPIGGGFAEMINNHIEGAQATAEVTGASVENMGLIMRGDADMALALADTVYQAYTGTGDFEGRQIENTRALASVYPNAVSVPSDPVAPAPPMEKYDASPVPSVAPVRPEAPSRVCASPVTE